MAVFINEVSRTFGEYLLIPGLTTEQCTPQNISLQTPLIKFNRDESPRIKLNIPFVSAIMQSVSNDTLAIELARNGGLSFNSRPDLSPAIPISDRTIRWPMYWIWSKGQDIII